MTVDIFPSLINFPLNHAMAFELPSVFTLARMNCLKNWVKPFLKSTFLVSSLENSLASKIVLILKVEETVIVVIVNRSIHNARKLVRLCPQLSIIRFTFEDRLVSLCQDSALSSGWKHLF